MDQSPPEGTVSCTTPCRLKDTKINALKSKELFPPTTIFRPFDANARADLNSDPWVCFPEYPFSLGFRYPFSGILKEFFDLTGLSYAQVMPMVWRTLFVIQSVNDAHGLHLGVPELAMTYDLRTHGSRYFLFRIKSERRRLVVDTTKNDPQWKGKFFFVDRRSIPEASSIPTEWVSKVNFEEVAPPSVRSESIISKFLEIPESERSFHHPDSTAMSVHFTLDDLDNELIIPEQKQVAPDPPKARTPNLRSRSGKKRKSQDPSTDSDLPPEIAKAIEVITTSYREKSELIQEMQETVDRQAAELARERSEIARIRREVKELKASLEKKDLEVASKIKEEREIFTTDIKNEARAVVFEARIKMASDVAAKGFDTSLWPVESWKKSLSFLKHIDPDVGSSLNEGGGKIPKPSSKKATKDLPAPAKEKAQANDAVYEGLGPIENLAMAAEMADTTPGDEGQ